MTKISDQQEKLEKHLKQLKTINHLKQQQHLNKTTA